MAPTAPHLADCALCLSSRGGESPECDVDNCSRSLGVTFEPLSPYPNLGEL